MTNDSSHNLDKRDVALKVLEGGTAMVHLDPRRAGVAVPPRFRGDPVLRLNFAYGFNLPQFVVDEEGVGAILNFNGERASCWVPWEAVFAITAPEHGHEGRFWPSSAPREMHEMLARAGTLEDGLTDASDGERPGELGPTLVPKGVRVGRLERRRRTRPALRAVPGDGADESPRDAGSAGDDLRGCDDERSTEGDASAPALPAPISSVSDDDEPSPDGQPPKAGRGRTAHLRVVK